VEAKEFIPYKYLALCCKTVIYSKREGHCCFCFCGDAYVDQTEYYIRLGGNTIDYQEPIVIGEDSED